MSVNLKTWKYYEMTQLNSDFDYYKLTGNQYNYGLAIEAHPQIQPYNYQCLQN